MSLRNFFAIGLLAGAWALATPAAHADSSYSFNFGFSSGGHYPGSIVREYRTYTPITTYRYYDYYDDYPYDRVIIDSPRYYTYYPSTIRTRVYSTYPGYYYPRYYSNGHYYYSTRPSWYYRDRDDHRDRDWDRHDRDWDRNRHDRDHDRDWDRDDHRDRDRDHDRDRDRVRRSTIVNPSRDKSIGSGSYVVRDNGRDFRDRDDDRSDSSRVFRQTDTRSLRGEDAYERGIGESRSRMERSTFGSGDRSDRILRSTMGRERGASDNSRLDSSRFSRGGNDANLRGGSGRSSRD